MPIVKYYTAQGCLAQGIAVLNLQCNEQFFVILWVSWCKNKSFWQRFTCKSSLLSYVTSKTRTRVCTVKLWAVDCLSLWQNQIEKIYIKGTKNRKQKLFLQINADWSTSADNDKRREQYFFITYCISLIFFCSIFDLEIVKFLHLKAMTFVKW